MAFEKTPTAHATEGFAARGVGLASLAAALGQRPASVAILLAASLASMGCTVSTQTNAPAAITQSQDTEWTQLNARVEAAYLSGEFSQGVEIAARALALAETGFGRDHVNTLMSVDTLALFYDALGRYAEAEPLHIRVLGARERVLGREHPQTLESVGNFALSYADQRRYAEAEPLYIRALQGSEHTLGRDHQTTLQWVNNLAGVYQALGRHAEAEPLYIRALETRERVLGREHPETLISVNDLGVLYYSQRRYAEARPLYIRGLEAKERTLGRDHPDTLISVINLALLYSDQSRYAEAEPLYIRALEAKERVLGRDHRDTLSSVNDLARLYQNQGRYADAEPLFRRALDSREHVLGREHADTLISVNNLGILYGLQGRYAEAELLLIRALEAKERVLGRDDPSTVRAVNNLAISYLDQGRYAEAEPLQIRALDGRERVLGREHPETLQSVNNVAVLYVAQRRYAEAEPLYLRVIEAKERIVGRDDPSTLSSVSSLAELYRLQGRYAEAEPLHIRALAGRERVLGREHPETLQSVGSLAVLLRSQERYAEAEPLYIRVLEARERLLGREHRDTLTSVNNLGALYFHQGRYPEAEPFYLRALEALQRALGGEHPDTLSSVQNLARLYQAQGRVAEAEPLYIRALGARERVLGRENPETARVAAELAALRLSSASEAASAIGPARLAVASFRARRVAAATGAFAEAQRGREESQGADNFSLLADAIWSASTADGAERTAEAFTTLQDATAGTTNRAVIQMAVRHIADDTGAGLGALVLEREGLNAQWAANNARYSAALGRSGSNAEALRRTLPAGRAQIEARMDAIDVTLRRDFPQYFALVRPEALDVAAAQALLAPDEAILMVVPTARGTHVMGVSRTSIEWVRSEWTIADVNGAVGQLLGNVRVTMGGGRFSYDRQTAYALYRHVVAPVARILEGKRHVFIVAGGSLTSMPFGILVTEEPQGANTDSQALRTTRWFADSHALINIPSIQSLQFLRRFGGGPRRDGDPSRSFVGFGDPVLQGQAIERGRAGSSASIASVFSGRQTRSGGGLADIGQIRLLNRLPGTAVELQSMRTALRAPAASLFLAERSTEHALRAMDLSGTRILVLATHGLVAGEVRGASEPGLVFTPPATSTDEDDGFLTASEVASLRLDADWVILSACNTAAGDGSAGAPGLSGLARAFFYAGARNLLASHWPVADDAAPRLTVRTIELMREHPDFSRAEALQGAMREVRGDPAHAPWAHPGVWAPFSLIGDGAN